VGAVFLFGRGKANQKFFSTLIYNLDLIFRNRPVIKHIKIYIILKFITM